MFAYTPLNTATAAHVSRIKLLPNERCNELLANIKHDNCRKSFDAVVTGFMPLALSVAMKFRHRGDINDLFQIACMNLMDAARTFNDGFATHFPSHARTWITLGLRRHLLFESRLIKVPENRAILKCYRRMHQFSAEKAPTVAQISAFVKTHGVTKDEFQAAYELYFATYESTSQGMDDDSDPLESRLSNGLTLEDEVIAADEQAATVKTVDRLMNVLNEREQSVIRARVLQDEPVQLRLVGEEMGVSYERIRQIEKQAMNKIRMAA
jgi:RNA polymerase sigma factor (sigma-70 family)